MNRNKNEKIVKQKIKNIQIIYERFSQAIDSLKEEQDKIINDLLERVEEEKIGEVMKKINKIGK